MNLKRLALIFLFACFVTSIAITTQTVNAAVINVPPGTIQAAVNAAAPGDTIIVAAGIYNEAVKIDKQLTLIGQPGAVIQPDDTTPLYDGGIRRPAIYITADDVTVQGFEIDGTHGTVHQGIYGINTDGLMIQNCVIHDMSNDAYDVAGNGIIVFGWGETVNNNMISGNTVYNTARMGIFVGGMETTNYKWIISTGNTISHNEVYNTWQGPTGDYGAAIQMNGAKNSLVANNKVHDTKPGANYYGVYIYASSTGNNILTNDVYNNQKGIVLWIDPTWAVFGSDVPGAPEVHNNNIYHNTDFGVWNVISPNPPLVVDATNNWWGDATGPHHTTSWLYMGNPYGPHLGLGDSVSDYVLYDPWRCTPWPTPVGGEWIPIDKLRLMAPSITLASLMTVVSASFAYVKHKKKKLN